MIKVALYENKNGEIYRFKILNHGQDIVCAGVSALAITCVNFLQSRFDFKFELKLDPKGGLIDFEAKEISKDISLIIDNMVFGLYQIMESYKKEIKIKIRSEL